MRAIFQWNVGSRILELGRRTLIMGVVNVTPDSFSDGGLYIYAEKAVVRAEQLLDDGATIIDVGGESTRPGVSEPVSEEEERRRVLPVIRDLKRRRPDAVVSVDTYKASVARAIMRRHPWLPSLLITRSVIGPHGLVLLEHVLAALAPHPVGVSAKLEAFAILNATTALFVHNELTGGSARQQRNAAYLHYALATGRNPRLAELLAPASPALAGPPETALEPAERYRDILARILY